MSPPKVRKLVLPDPKSSFLPFSVVVLTVLSTEYGSSKQAVSGDATSKRNAKVASPGGHVVLPSQDAPGVLHQLGCPCVVGAGPAGNFPQDPTSLQGALPVLRSTELWPRNSVSPVERACAEKTRRTASALVLPTAADPTDARTAPLTAKFENARRTCSSVRPTTGFVSTERPTTALPFAQNPMGFSRVPVFSTMRRSVF
eukprot:scaffold40574_cov27-Tisochrysis_lutea.AAC.11